MLNETGERTGPEAVARRWLGGQLQAAVVKGEYTVVVADNDRLDRDYLEAFTHSNIVAFFTASPAALGFTGFISRADVDRCPPGSVKAVFNRIGGRIPVFGAGHPGRYPLDHKFLLIEFLPASMRVAAIDATGGEPAFLSSSGSTFQYTAEFAPIP
jgi:hypothetical protein